MLSLKGLFSSVLVVAATGSLINKRAASGTCLPALEYEPRIGYDGRYTDVDENDRTLKGPMYTTSQNDPHYCANLCGLAGYKLAGLEDTDQCFCGNSINPRSEKTEESACNATCPGNSSTTCGASYIISIYSIENPSNGTGLSHFPDCNREPLCSHDVCDTSLTPKERATALVSSFTIEEKLFNRVNSAPGAPRLGLAPYQWWNEALHGLAESPGSNFASEGDWSYATSFPQPIVMGAAFDDEMILEIAEIIGTETRAFHNAGRSGINLYTPNINAFKDPRWGRGQETPGEDPFHLQSYVAAMLSGLEDSSSGYKKTIATCKHYAANDFEQFGDISRYNFDANITMQDLSEYYLPPFKTCAAEKQVGSFMCSYNGINGHPLCAHHFLLEDVLRQHWGWESDEHFITTDCEVIPFMVDEHEYASNLGEAASLALKAGTDLECNNSPGAEAIISAWNQSLVTEEELDKSLIRLWSSLVSVGLFDPVEAQPLRALDWGNVNTEKAQELAYSAAVSGSVLIKNNDILPLDPRKNQSFAFIGPWVEATTQMQGIYSGPAPYLVSPRRAAEDRGINFNFIQGAQINDTDESFDAAIEAARNADVVLFMGGIDDSMERESHDRSSLAWPEPQGELLGALSQVGTPVIVVQFGAGQLDDSELLGDDNVGAILWAGYPGQSGGKAVLDILFGKAAPAGRLPVTQYPAAYNDIPPTDMNLRPSPGNSGLGRTYMWYNGEAPVPFGFGLHFTKFSVDVDGRLESDEIQELVSDSHWQETLLRPVLTLTATVTNEGDMTSDYVALLFSKSDAGPTPRPIKTLEAYKRARDVKPGQSESLQLVVTLERLVRVDGNGNRVLHPGKYTVFVDLEEEALFEFELKGDAALVERFPQPT